MNTEETLLALSRLLNFDTRFNDDVAKILDRHAGHAAANAAPVVAPLTPEEIAAWRAAAQALASGAG